ncbi:MAG: acylphosphatase, partial [Candidatus Heimdallarchaeota archaeon]|nr:acylphosphatase [Candidatus Heimdallarchaeota archaeon]
MKKRGEIILKGRVQKAGFRDYINEIAFNLNLRGWVRNLDD